MNSNATCGAGIAHDFKGDRTSAAIWWRCARPRFRPVIRRQRGGRASDDPLRIERAAYFVVAARGVLDRHADLFRGLDRGDVQAHRLGSRQVSGLAALPHGNLDAGRHCAGGFAGQPERRNDGSERAADSNAIALLT